MNDILHGWTNQFVIHWQRIIRKKSVNRSIRAKIISHFAFQFLNSIALAFWTRSRRACTLSSRTRFWTRLNAFLDRLFRRTRYRLGAFRGTTHIFDLLAGSLAFTTWTRHFLLFLRFYPRTGYIPNIFSNHLLLRAWYYFQMRWHRLPSLRYREFSWLNSIHDSEIWWPEAQMVIAWTCLLSRIRYGALEYVNVEWIFYS